MEPFLIFHNPWSSKEGFSGDSVVDEYKIRVTCKRQFLGLNMEPELEAVMTGERWGWWERGRGCGFVCQGFK